MIKFSEFVNEALTDIQGNYKTTWYEVSRHVLDNKDKDRASRVVTSDKAFEDKIKKAIQKIDKLTGLETGEYGVLFKSGDVKCGFIAMVDNPNDQTLIRQRLHPMSKKYDKALLVMSNLPCRDDYPSVRVDHKVNLSEAFPQEVLDSLLVEGTEKDSQIYMIELDI